MVHRRSLPQTEVTGPLPTTQSATYAVFLAHVYSAPPKSSPPASKRASVQPYAAAARCATKSPTHRFFGPNNLLLITGANLAGVTDAVVTRHFIARGESEGDPIERPFIQNGLGGFIAIGLITEAAAIGIMYGLHHMGHHLLERLLPIAVMIGEGRSDYQVVRDTY